MPTNKSTIASDKNKQIASPISTGGAGVSFENHVGAYYLASVIIGSVPYGLGGIARELRFQRLYDGEPLDDLVVIADVPAGEMKLALQIKRDLVIGKKSKTFYEILSACWETFKAPKFKLGTDRFGFVLALYSKTIDEHYQAVLKSARNSSNASDFLQKIATQKLSSKEQRGFLNLVQSGLNKYHGSNVTKDDLWQFLRSMEILHLDFDQDNSKDIVSVLGQISQLLPAERRTDASGLFSKLVQYAAEAASTAGSLDARILRQKLQSDGFQLLPARECKEDFARLRQHAEFILKDIRSDIGGIVLDRGDVIASAIENIQNHALVELVGPPGIGKSVVLKALAEKRQEEGSAIVLAGDRLTGTGWDGFAHDLQLTRPLCELLLSMSSNPAPCIFIDGIDRISEFGPQKAVNDLLHTLDELPLNKDGTRHWTVVVSAREDNLQEVHAWFDWRGLGIPKVVKIPELTQAEIDLVANRIPHFKPLVAMKQLQPLVKNPFTLSLLEHESLLSNPAAITKTLTEVDVSSVWWERIVNNGRTKGLERQQALLELGRYAAFLPGRRLSMQGISGNTIKSLEDDRILRRDSTDDAYRFAHDLFEDWVLFRVLNQERNNLAEFLKQLGQPPGLLRATHILGSFLLEQHQTADVWANLLQQLEACKTLAPRWRQTLLLAPVTSSQSRELLMKAEPFLIANDAKWLIELMLALRTVEVEPDFSLIGAAIDLSKEPSELLSLMLLQPIPRMSIWYPFLEWFTKHLGDIPAQVRPEAARFFEIWQRYTPPGFKFRKEIGEKAFEWLKQLERW